MNSTLHQTDVERGKKENSKVKNEERKEGKNEIQKTKKK